MQVVGAAAQTLCALATLSPTAKQRLSGLLQQYMLWLQDKSTKLLNTDSSPIQLQSHVAATCRCMYHVCLLLCCKLRSILLVMIDLTKLICAFACHCHLFHVAGGTGMYCMGMTAFAQP